MKLIRYLSVPFLFFYLSAAGAQQKNSDATDSDYPARALTAELAIGINPWPMSDMLVSTMVQWNIHRRLTIASLSSYSYNNAFLRDFNHIKTNYNYSLSQKFGVGTSLYSKHFAHSIFLMAGVKYDAFKETLENPEFETVSASVSSLSPDLGLIYNVKVGRGNYFFSYRMYIPLYPYPVKTIDLWSLDGNMANLSLEFGVGICLE